MFVCCFVILFADPGWLQESSGTSLKTICNFRTPRQVLRGWEGGSRCMLNDMRFPFKNKIMDQEQNKHPATHQQTKLEFAPTIRLAACSRERKIKPEEDACAPTPLAGEGPLPHEELSVDVDSIAPETPTCSGVLLLQDPEWMLE